MLINLIGGIYHRALLLLVLGEGFLRLFGSLILQLSLPLALWRDFRKSIGPARE